MNRVSRAFLFSIALLFVLWQVWSKVHIGVYIYLTFWQAIALVGIVSFVLFLVLDHLFNGDR